MTELSNKWQNKKELIWGSTSGYTNLWLASELRDGAEGPSSACLGGREGFLPSSKLRVGLWQLWPRAMRTPAEREESCAAVWPRSHTRCLKVTTVFLFFPARAFEKIRPQQLEICQKVFDSSVSQSECHFFPLCSHIRTGRSIKTWLCFVFTQQFVLFLLFSLIYLHVVFDTAGCEGFDGSEESPHSHDFAF